MKKITFPLIALLLASSILTPSLLSILDKSHDIVVLTDSNEEEKHGETETEKKFDEKDFFLNSFQFSNSDLTQIKSPFHVTGFISKSEYVKDIVLPPPRVV